METNWTETGTEHFNEEDRPRILEAIESMVWEPVEGSKPMSPALGIQACIEQLGIPKVSEVAIRCVEFAPYGFYGVRAQYKNGRAEIFFLDRGSDILPVVSTFVPN